MKRFWVSWIQLTEDERPLTDPPTEEVIGWWCSGHDAADRPILCAVIEAESEDKAKDAVEANWEEKPGEVGPFRFIEEVAPDFHPGNRFPIANGWMAERFNVGR
ncbi:MAG: hypothetical protein KF855_03295 [Acidobacteria bacterium]|nr:hypothetical protein [Acidobacteriota bacterium]